MEATVTVTIGQIIMIVGTVAVPLTAALVYIFKHSEKKDKQIVDLTKTFTTATKDFEQTTKDLTRVVDNNTRAMDRIMNAADRARL